MAILTIGRVGLDTELGHARQIQDRRGLRRSETVITGFLKSTSQANTDSLRTELLNQQGDIVAVTYTGDAKIDGFYLLVDSRIETIPTSYMRNGLFPFEVTMFRIGGESSTEFQSLVTGTVLTNDHEIVEGDATFWHATPVGAQAYNAGAGTPILHTRTSEDGTVDVYLNVDLAEDPTWSVAPSSYYSGACEIYTEGYLRTGLDIPNNAPANWELQNGIVRARPEVYQGTSNGQIRISYWNGSAWAGDWDWEIERGANVIPGWNYMSILRNDPEMASVRLVRDADEGTPTAHRHTLDMTVRRGSQVIFCYYSYTGTALGYDIETADLASAGVVVTPTGATGNVGLRENASGVTWLAIAVDDWTATGTGGISLDATTTSFAFALGWADSASTHDTADDICLQYHGWLSDVTRAVRR